MIDAKNGCTFLCSHFHTINYYLPVINITTDILFIIIENFIIFSIYDLTDSQQCRMCRTKKPFTFFLICKMNIKRVLISLYFVPCIFHYTLTDRYIFHVNIKNVFMLFRKIIFFKYYWNLISHSHSFYTDNLCIFLHSKLLCKPTCCLFLFYRNYFCRWHCIHLLTRSGKTILCQCTLHKRAADKCTNSMTLHKNFFINHLLKCLSDSHTADMKFFTQISFSRNLFSRFINS